MLSLVACFGFQPTCNKTSKTSIQVYSKLGGTFLGAIQRPCVKNVDAYSVLRKLQDQVATWLCHPKMPPRYLALFVGSTRLTSPDFPFVDHLDAKLTHQVLDLLGKALRIDALWDDGIHCAEKRLASMCSQAKVVQNKLVVAPSDIHHRNELLPCEVEAFTFGATIKILVVKADAQGLGCVHLFPHLEELDSKGWLQEVDFKRLAQIKALTRLNIGVEYLNEDVSFMTSLKKLSVETSEVGCIPTTIGLLTRLTHLVLTGGFAGSIPREIGNLCGLTSLKITETQVSGRIPSELCKLTKLSSLELSYNPRLSGSLPDEFGNLKLLSYFSLQNTPVGTNGFFLDGWLYQTLPTFKSYWTRQV